jgi:hypothetical protein
MAGELQELAQVRGQLTAVALERQELQVDLRRARDTLTLLDRRGAPRAERTTVERQIRDLQASIDALSLREGELLGRIDRLRGVVSLGREEDAVEQLDGQVPVLLLPVRLETRFMPGTTELRVRIYPEQIHIDAHEPGLTDQELTRATAYWAARWAATSTEQHTAAWRELLRTVRPARARWLATVTEPTNLDEIGTGTPKLPDGIALRAGPFTRQPTARLLPEKWVAIGFRNGTEVTRVWGEAVTEGIPVGLPPDLDDDGTQVDVPDDQGTLALDDSIAWLVDYEKALAAGMAITITERDVDGGRLRDGLDELVVLGVDWGADPQAAAVAIDEQLRRHAFTEGLSVLGPGVPTNNTDDSRAAPGTDPELDGAAFDPAAVAAAPATVVRVGTALGIDPAVGLDRAPAAGSLDDGTAGDMNNAMWAATLGAFLDQMMAPVVTSEVAEEVHDHFRRFVRGQGPYVALRVGRQPYGVLPVTAGAVSTGDAFLDGLAFRLRGLRPFWSQSAGDVPRLGDSEKPDVDAVELLRRTPRSSTFRFRRAFAGSASSSILGFDVAAVFQELVANMTLALAGVQGRPRIAGITLDPTARTVPVPLVTYDDLSETDPLDPDYIAEVLTKVTNSGGFRALLTEPDKARTLLEALLRQAAGAEYVIGSTLLVIAHELETQVITELPPIARVLDPEVIGIAADQITRPDADAPESILARVESPVEIAETTIRAVSGNRTVANHLAVTPNAELRRFVSTRRFAEFRASLGRLAKLPTAELDRLAGSTLDCVSHRLDAWLTSVATRHLGTLRSERGRDTYIGGFGYVEDLRPSADPVSRGFLHGPSIAHATTAAILRSGHLARGENAEGTFAVDLSSRRVARATDLIDGVRRGQPIGALLGYRFERAVRDADLKLAKYILPIRQRTPLAQVSTGPDPATEALESIAARDVVDGVALLDAWRADRNAYWASVPVPTGDRAKLDPLVEQLDDALDAVSDVLVAEGIHQAVLGNAERSAAALDALDRQQPLPDLGVTRTPRTATGLSHRLLILFADDGPAPGWTVDDPRRKGDPRVDAWCGAILGNPTRYRLAAEARDADDNVLQEVSARLSDLGISALSTVAASAAAGTDATELEQRLALHLGKQVSAENAKRTAALHFLEDPPAGGAAGSLGLRDLLDLTEQISGLLSAARQADARALLPDTERPNPGIDLRDLKDRADGARSTLTAAVTDLEALRDDSDVDDVVAALLAAADAGIPGAAPGPAPPLEQAALVALTGRSALKALDDAEAAFAAKATTAAEASPPVAVTDEDHAAHHLQRLRIVFGESFPAVVRFTLPGPTGPDAQDFRASLTASATDPALVGSDHSAASWLGMHVPVRPAVGRLTGALEASEMLGGRLGLGDLHVAQLPHRPGAAWIGLPFDTTPPPTTSWVLHAAARPAFEGTLAGVIVDQWGEAVPSTTETTGVSFHFDAPGARAPQTVLIATPTDRGATRWTVDALTATVREAVDLARIRPLDIDDVDAVARFLPGAYLPFNLEAKVPSVNLSATIAIAVAAHNITFQEAEA